MKIQTKENLFFLSWLLSQLVSQKHPWCCIFVWLHGFHLFHARHKRSPCRLSSRQRRPEKTVSVHCHLAGALLCLHLSFLLSSCWVLVLNVADEDWICKGLGLLLHWSLMATFLWMAVEGFHLYLLLVRVFNIYIKRYVLKLSLVAWGEGIVPSIHLILSYIFS